MFSGKWALNRLIGRHGPLQLLIHFGSTPAEVVIVLDGAIDGRYHPRISDCGANTSGTAKGKGE